MVETLQRISVFLSSPSDVAEERRVAKRIVDEINLDLGYRGDFHIELLTWETHSSAGVAESAQVVISKDIGSEYDIYLGVMRSKFGTPTGKYSSGTEYEYADALRRRTEGENVEIMFFFYSGDLSIADSDLSQLQKVMDFKREIGRAGGVRYTEYGSQADYNVKLRRELIHRVQDIVERSKKGKDKIDTVQVDENKFSNFNQLVAGSASVAIKVHTNSAIKNIDKVTSGLRMLGVRTGKMAESVAKVSALLKAASTPGKTPNSGSNKKAVDEASAIVFSTALLYQEFMSGDWEGNFIAALSTTQRVAYIAHDDGQLKDEEVVGLIQPIETLRDSILGSTKTIDQFVDVVHALENSIAIHRTDLFVSLQVFRAVSLDLKAVFLRTVEAMDGAISSLRELV